MVLNESPVFAGRSACLCLGDLQYARRASFASQKLYRGPATMGMVLGHCISMPCSDAQRRECESQSVLCRVPRLRQRSNTHEAE
jgi:hypothetical protein